MTTTLLTVGRVRAFFDDEVRKGRRLLPDPATASGFGTFAKYSRTAALIAEPSIRTVLDVGCSVGSIEALFHAQHPDRARDVSIDGVDISSEAIRQASTLGLPRCAFRTYDGERLPFASACFDLVIAIEVIEHVVDTPRLIAEIARVLRPGGRVWLTTPNPQCWALRAERRLDTIARWWLRRPSPEKDAFVRLADLSRLLEAAGLRPVGAGSEPFWPRLYVSMLGWGVLPPLPPRALALYQRLCVAACPALALRGFVGRRLGWTTVALWTRPHDTNKDTDTHADATGADA
jgi:2-polyprenyl-3-methyl-5-hydroxy-6-metoxy-1,4-benzoquinol methylase